MTRLLKNRLHDPTMAYLALSGLGAPLVQGYASYRSSKPYTLVVISNNQLIVYVSLHLGVTLGG